MSCLYKYTFQFLSGQGTRYVCVFFPVSLQNSFTEFKLVLSVNDVERWSIALHSNVPWFWMHKGYCVSNQTLGKFYVCVPIIFFIFKIVTEIGKKKRKKFQLKPNSQSHAASSNSQCLLNCRMMCLCKLTLIRDFLFLTVGKSKNWQNKVLIF